MPTPEGTATAALAAFFFLLATNLMAGWLFFLVAFLVALLAVGFFTAAAGARAARVTLTAETVRTVEGGEVALPLLVEGLAGARFLRIAAAAGGQEGVLFVGRIRRGQRQPQMLRFPAPARGAHPIDQVEIVSRGVVGLFRFRRPQPVRGEVLVRPRFQRLAALPEGEGRDGEGAPARRRGEELVGTREYLPGDPARHIHWRSSRRHRRLIVKEFEDPATPLAAIVVDADAAQPREAFDRAVRAAASLANSAIEGGLAVTVAAAEARGSVVVRGAWERIWDALARLRADGPPLPQAMAQLGALLPPGRAPLIVTAGGRGVGRGGVVVGPQGAETPWEFDAEGGVRRRWRA